MESRELRRLQLTEPLRVPLDRWEAYWWMTDQALYEQIRVWLGATSVESLPPSESG